MMLGGVVMLLHYGLTKNLGGVILLRPSKFY